MREQSLIYNRETAEPVIIPEAVSADKFAIHLLLLPFTAERRNSHKILFFI